MDLMKKLGIIVLVFSTFLFIRTLVAPPLVKTVKTADDLKAYLCETTWWDHWFSISKFLMKIFYHRYSIIATRYPLSFVAQKRVGVFLLFWKGSNIFTFEVVALDSTEKKKLTKFCKQFSIKKVCATMLVTGFIC